MRFHPKGLILLGLFGALSGIVGTIEMVAVLRVISIAAMLGVFVEGLTMSLTAGSEGITGLFNRVRTRHGHEPGPN